MLHALPLSGLVGRGRALWGSFLCSILLIFPFHQILSVASFILRTCVFSHQQDCWRETGVLLQKIHAWRVRVPHAISSKIVLLFKAFRNALVSWNSAWTTRTLLGRKSNETSTTDSLKCMFFSSLVSTASWLQKQPPEYSPVASA